MEGAPENGKEWSHSAHAKGIDECLTNVMVVTGFEVPSVEDSYCVFMVRDTL